MNNVTDNYYPPINTGSTDVFRSTLKIHKNIPYIRLALRRLGRGKTSGWDDTDLNFIDNVLV